MRGLLLLSSQIPSETVIEWVRKNYKNIGNFNKKFPFYIYDYITQHFQCSFEDFLQKDYLFCEFNKHTSDFLFENNETNQQPMLGTFKKFSCLDLENFYKDFFTKSREQKTVEGLGFFSLLCLRQVLNYQTKDDFDVLLTILETNMKYCKVTLGVILKSGDPREVFFKIAHNGYKRRHHLNTSLDSYRLGKMGYKVYKEKKSNYDFEKTLGQLRADYTVIPQEPELQKLIRASENLLATARMQDPSASLLSKSYRYLALIKGHLNDPENAKEYLNLAHFWDDKSSPQKIARLRIQIALSAFAKKDYLYHS